MEILQLKYFLESAKNESFTQTAQMFQVPTTSVSASVKRLEGELDFQLFDRNKNKIVLNANGKRFQQAVASAFNSINSAISEISAHGDDKREIKLLVRGMRRKITDLISEYSSKFPHVSFKISFDFNETDYTDYDIIIDEMKDTYTDFQRIELFSIRLYFKCAQGNPLLSKKLTVAQLSEQPFITMGTNSNMHRILSSTCLRAGFTPKISAICNDIECYEKLILSGMGIGIVRGTDNKLITLEVADFNEKYTVFAYYRQAEFFGNLKSFVEFLRAKNV